MGWGEWTEWGDCSRTCGGGFKIRRRTCLNWPCTGWTWAMEGCNYDNCPTPAPPQPVTVVPSAEPFTARGKVTKWKIVPSILWAIFTNSDCFMTMATIKNSSFPMFIYFCKH